jgi:hypothetical protein
MQIVATIRPGHRIVTEDRTFEVYGSLKSRSGYKYLVIDTSTKQKLSLGREDVLQAQREGSAMVTA